MALILIEEPQIVVHEADQPDLVSDLFDDHEPAREHAAEVDLALADGSCPDGLWRHPMEVLGFDHMVLCVTDVARSIEFFSTLLGMQPREDGSLVEVSNRLSANAS